MNARTLRTMVMGLVVAAMALSLTGCGIPISITGQSVDLIGEMRVPTLEVPLEDIPDGWRVYLEGQDYEESDEFCDLPDLGGIQAMAQDRNIPNFLARRIRVRAVNVTSVDFIATEGDFSTLREIDTVLTIGDAPYRFHAANPNGFGTEESLTPDPALNLANFINDATIECVGYDLRIQGTPPEDDLVFKVVLRFDLELLLRIF